MDNINRILLAVDGSENAQRATAHLIALLKAGGMPAHEVHVLNVQLPVPTGFVGHDTVEQYHRIEADKALAPALKLLQVAGIQHAPHILVGQIAETIARYATEHQCGQIVIGTRGMSTIAGLVLGSVASRLIHLAPVPVTLVK